MSKLFITSCRIRVKYFYDPKISRLLAAKDNSP